MSRLTIVGPCSNEERRLDPDAFLEFTVAHPNVRFLMVDDGSTDGTVRVLERMVDGGNGAVELLRLPENAGKAEAVRRGVLEAVKHAPEGFGYWDADLSTALEELAAIRILNIG